MKKMLCALLMAGMACSVQATSGRQDMSNVSGEYGNVRFHGRVFVSPCVLDMASRDQTIDLGDISASRFRQGGDRSDPVVVTLYLNGCLKGSGHTLRDFPGQTSEMPELAYSTVERGVSMTMMAEGAPENSDLGRIRGDVRGAGIRLLTERKQLIHLNQPQRMWILKPGDNAIHFLAALESFGREVTAGEFNGLVRLKLEYL
ncbi:MrfE family protein [Citrobacter freundii ATCC 8090 = MTCC 1658 = NBRC 12681]|uniref:fimbrial protein n=1 Tax=Citrobacter freundii TaxID=546 RepID=UPI000299B3D3|nr:fimbrial protein [Citrobacter freundii]EKS56799.1 putative fimbrial subunit [Citrobacter freundii ATCC 8090 = MTCC 1658 = NBRC 12681]EXF28704.1 fimbrial protein [Citrobacter freundii RLS1]KFB98992.1 MrfE family protein [Citrobacter freundii ATCC 8090 = MTCC 1658 = NBRC 12681]MBQ0343827.1 type 1 fimbrial protein [Citrobacter freundii]MBS6111245.1 type 1 fimbrial protein [Citrobacter freundii]